MIASITSPQAQVASILHTDYNIKKQSGSSDCGLFAIAYATALALGERPELIILI